MNFKKDKVKDVMRKMRVSISHFYDVLFSSPVIKSSSFQGNSGRLGSNPSECIRDRASENKPTNRPIASGLKLFHLLVFT